jgi:RNA polymerase sporulation-specific sigma factor
MNKIVVRIHKLAHRLQLLFLKVLGKIRRPIYYIGGSETLPSPLNSEEEKKALILLAAGDAGIKQVLIEHNLRLVVYIARKFENTGINIEDLISIGTIGLIKAVNTFDPGKNIKLATYASRCIENEILMHLRRTNKLKTEISLDEPLNIDWDGNELLLSDVLGTESDIIYKAIEGEIERSLLFAAMKNLSTREKNYYGNAFWFGRQLRENTERSCPDAGHFSIIYFTFRKTYYPQAAKRYL